MRKSVPVLLFTTAFALASGSAFALGDRNKEKKAADGTTVSTQSANTSGSMASSARCDATKYASRADLPKDCPDTTGTRANQAGSTTGTTGGDSGASGSGSSSSPGASGSSASGSSGSGSPK